MSLLDSLTNKTISIECEAHSVVDIHDLHPLQGKLKELKEEDYEKLKRSILELGFSDPFSVWVDPQTNLKYIHDGHERRLTLLRMEQEGFTLPQFPASFIQAKDKLEAKKKLLANDSSYGKITQEGLYEFMNEEGFELSEADLAPFVEIEAFENEFFSEEDKKEIKDEKLDPKCEMCLVYHASNHHQETN